MVEKTRGIVLQQIRYGDNSRIVHIYTERFGRLALMVKGMGKRSGIRRAHLQPLTLLDLQISYKASRDLQSIREAHISVPLPDIPRAVYKTSIALFISEVLSKTLTEEDANPSLFSFLHNAIIQLDREREGTHLFHLFLLAQLTRFLGFHPVNRFSGTNRYFDLREGVFVSFLPPHPDFMESEEASFFSSLLDPENRNTPTFHKLPPDKKKFLEKMLLYYRIHLEGMGRIKSLDILHEVFH